MKTVSLSLAIAALAAGCTTVSPPDQTFAYRAGYGVVESVRAAHVAVPDGAVAGSPAARGSYNTPVDRLFRPRWTDGYQLVLRMDDGTEQALTQSSGAFKPGDRVQVMPDGVIARVQTAPTAAMTLRPGMGTVESVVSEGAASASAGASADSSAAPPYRVTLRMDDGTVQAFRDNSLRFRPRERVRVEQNGALVRQ